MSESQIFLKRSHILNVLKAEVLLNPDYYNKIKQNCYKRVEQNFRWNIVSKKLEDLYNKIIEDDTIS